MWLSNWLLKKDVVWPLGSHPACWLPPAASPQTNWSGTLNSMVPRRQLS
jgi:hypothetical protein